MTTYMVVIDGAGEYEREFDVLIVNADTPAEAVSVVTAPEHGWGRREDGCAFVAKAECVSAFSVNDTTRKTVLPDGALFDKLSKIEAQS